MSIQYKHEYILHSDNLYDLIARFINNSLNHYLNDILLNDKIIIYTIFINCLNKINKT